jgi:hypothetical protein
MPPLFVRMGADVLLIVGDARWSPVLSISGPIFFGTETLLPLKCSDRRDAKGLRLQLWLLPWCRQLARTWSLSAAPDFPTGWR